MRWINALERRFSHLAFPGLIRIVVVFNLLTFLLVTMKPELLNILTLRPDRVRAGEVWRLVSYVFIPPVPYQRPDLSVIIMFFYMNFLWIVGEGLEQAWGSFKLNLFYFIGMLGTAIAALCFGLPDVTGMFLNWSLFLAFATLFPDFPMLLFYILPVRIKWMALLLTFYLALIFLGGTNPVRLAIIVALANYLIFFTASWVRRWREEGKIAKRQQEFQIAQHSEEEETLHRCKVCNRTELSSPELDFRVSDDGEEYCLAHLPSRQMHAPPPLPE